MALRTVGFPCTRHEAGEVREFLPTLIGFLEQFSLDRIVLEDGYGTRMQLSPQAYATSAARVDFASRDEAFAQDLVVTLRCPVDRDLDRLRSGAILLSMLHFPTRPARVLRLHSRGVFGIAMDQIVDDLGRRLIENLEAVGTFGVRSGMQALARTWPEFDQPTRNPLRVTILGAGAVGAHAMRAAARYADAEVRLKLKKLKVPGVIVTVLDVELASDATQLEAALEKTDLLVDATQRADTSRAVVTNAQLGRLPPHAVIVDLSADPYDLDRPVPSVKAIEGIPSGNLDQYVFLPDDAAWTAIDPRIDHHVKRTTVSCYSWPGIDPVACMNVYGKQLEPVVRSLITRGTDLPQTGGAWADRATGRGLHTRWLPGVSA